MSKFIRISCAFIFILLLSGLFLTGASYLHCDVGYDVCMSYTEGNASAEADCARGKRACYRISKALSVY